MMNFLLNSRIAWAAVALSLALSWHYIDKAAAVRSAEKELADLAQIESLKSLLNELQRREGIARRAGESLRSKANEAEQTALQAEKELEEYVKTTNQNSSGIVDSGLHGRLRNK